MADVDVLIVGAGAAGLAAARALSDRGRSLAILEARERTGGRILTIRPAGASLPMELGAEFVHGRQPATFALAQAAGLTLYESTGEMWLADRGQLISTTSFRSASGADARSNESDESDEGGAEEGEDEFSAILAALRQETGPDRSFQAFLNERFAGARWESARRRASGYVEGYDAADPATVSAQWLAFAEAADDPSDGNRQFRILEGYDRLVESLRAGLAPARATLHLNTVVEEIAWSPGHVVVATHGSSGEASPSFTARAAIVTLPLGVLAAPPGATAAVRFVPALPEKAAAIQGMAMGHAAKMVLRFREVFWDAPAPSLPQLPRLSFLFGGDAAFPTWWSSYPLLAPTLTAWLGGPRAAQLAGQPPAGVANQAVAALARVLGIPRQAVEQQLVGWEMHPWSSDPFARGAYSYVLVGGMDAPRQLAVPVADTLFFAGEATDAAQMGTVHAALTSGQRAAGEVLECLDGDA